ncbi:pirin family protein [Sedimenticola selenatireducens]|uniref:Quercetin 2,3-dioxygenase n=1 Tax=Sedimenticola selenatireducens TaxID=191960 RepID=A0A2N6D0Y4_9GAMM|nr:pirin family protein [Sedimenticola selenatireducens]PLX63361.1 MAG: quercetin 2,3-dioxygenase [Sedimenticola selenatireducens]
MKQIRAANDRGYQHHDWLETHYSFSFADYYDPAHMGISILRVINDDRIAPAGGFPTHPHQDMEIVTYVLDGVLEHKDSMGNGSLIRPGDIQRMSAGTGVRHSEFNHSDQQPVHLLQIWLLPNRKGVTPGYAQKHFPPSERRNLLQLLVSPDGSAGSISAHQDGLIYGTLLEPGKSVSHELAAERIAYVHIARGKAVINNETLGDGDAITLSEEPQVKLSGVDESEILLFDLPQGPGGRQHR